jgi:predicted GIY-YIG superfamily endonuclease
MSQTPKTIQIFLPDGDPRGLRVAEITTRIVQAIEVPRSLLGNFFKMPESNRVAVYYLIGENEEGSGPVAYIGQTGDLRKRLAKHNSDKSFWERALVVISLTGSLTQTHALFLEWYSLQKMREAGRYSDNNGNSGSKPHTPAPLESDCLEIFETSSILLSTLGHPLFSSLVKQSREEDQKDTVYYCQGSGADGQGVYTPEGFVVLKGSTGQRENVPSIVGTATERTREKILSSDIVTIEGSTISFDKDHLFPSPSAAAIALMGRSANGWLEWKTKDGKTLDELERQQTGDEGETSA